MKWVERMMVNDEYEETWRATAVEYFKVSQYLPLEPQEVL
jgi:hypothetical protein